MKIPEEYFSKTIGIKTEMIEPGVVRGSVALTARHLNIAGTLHGGVIMSFMDSLMGHAAWSIDPKPLATSHMNSHFLEAVRGGALTGEGRVLSRQDQYVTTEAEVRDESGRLVASGQAQFTYLRENRVAIGEADGLRE